MKQNTQLVKNFPSFYGTRRFITLFTTAPPLVTITSHVNQFQTPSYFFRILFNIILPSVRVYLKVIFMVFLNKQSIHVSPTYILHATSVSSFLSFSEQHLVGSTDRKAHHYMVPCYFYPLRPKYLPQRPILEHPQPMLLP